MANPDWAKRKLLRLHTEGESEDDYRACSIPLEAVAKLLRAERRKTVRLVKRLRFEYQSSDGSSAAENALNDLLAKLEAR